MKHVLLAGAGLFVLAMAQPSVAADMPRPVTKAPAMVAAPMFNWSGFYVGGNVGYGWGKYKEELFDGGSSVASESIGLDGAFVGGQIGANVQTGSIVWGVEADIQKSWIGGDERWAFPGLTVTAEVEVDWFATLRGRVGIAHGPSLFFLTGGIAHGEGTVSSQSTEHRAAPQTTVPAGRSALAMRPRSATTGPGNLNIFTSTTARKRRTLAAAFQLSQAFTITL